MKDPSLYSSGAKQSDRHPGDLLSEDLRIDGKTNSDFFHYVLGFSRLLQFWNADNMPFGNWEKFFQKDSAFLFSSIEQTSLLHFTTAFHEKTQDFQETSLNSEREIALVGLYEVTLDLITLLSGWYEEIHKHALKNPNEQEIEQMVSELLRSNIWEGALYLSSFFRKMLYFFSQNPNWIARKNLEADTNKNLYLLKKMIGIEEEAPMPERNVPVPGDIPLDSYIDFFEFITRLYESLLGTTSLLQAQASPMLEQTLQQPHHAPQVTLLIALRKMMEPLQFSLNRFSKKHLEFYYKKVLLQRPSPHFPDETPVHFKPSPTHPSSFHPKGTPLSAGNDSAGRPVIYKTTRDLKVSHVKPVAFKTLFNGTAGEKMPLAVQKRLYASPAANSGDGTGGKFTAKPPSWPTMGSDELEEKQAAALLANLGWAISSPEFFLSDGDRQLILFWEVEKDAMTRFLKELIELGLPPNEEAVHLFLSRCFRLEYTSPKGWVSPVSVSLETTPPKEEATTHPPPPTGPSEAAPPLTKEKTPQKESGIKHLLSGVAKLVGKGGESESPLDKIADTAKQVLGDEAKKILPGKESDLKESLESKAGDTGKQVLGDEAKKILPGKESDLKESLESKAEDAAKKLLEGEVPDIFSGSKGDVKNAPEPKAEDIGKQSAGDEEKQNLAGSEVDIKDSLESKAKEAAKKMAGGQIKKILSGDKDSGRKSFQSMLEDAAKSVLSKAAQKEEPGGGEGTGGLELKAEGAAKNILENRLKEIADKTGAGKLLGASGLTGGLEDAVKKVLGAHVKKLISGWLGDQKVDLKTIQSKAEDAVKKVLTDKVHKVLDAMPEGKKLDGATLKAHAEKAVDKVLGHSIGKYLPKTKEKASGEKPVAAEGEGPGSQIKEDKGTESAQTTAPGKKNGGSGPAGPEPTSSVGGSAARPRFGLCFKLLIPADHPPVSAYIPKVHGKGYTTSYPVIRFLLNQQVLLAEQSPGDAAKEKKKPVVINPYPLFKKIQTRSGQFQLRSENVRNFVFQNDISALKPDSPFFPFGAKPVKDGNFYIGNREIFNRPLSKLSLEVEWYDLPKLQYGFCEYYQVYNQFKPLNPYTNSAFQCQAEILQDKKWAPIPLIPPPVPPESPASEEQKDKDQSKEPKKGTPPQTEEKGAEKEQKKGGETEEVKKVPSSVPQKVKPSDPATETSPEPGEEAGEKADNPLKKWVDEHSGSVKGGIAQLEAMLNSKELEPNPAKVTPPPPNPALKAPHYPYYLFDWEITEPPKPPDDQLKETHAALKGVLGKLKGVVGTIEGAASKAEDSSNKQAGAEGKKQEKKSGGLLGNFGGKISSVISGKSSSKSSKSGKKKDKKKDKADSPPPSDNQGEGAEPPKLPPPAKCPKYNEGKLKPVSVFQFDMENLSWNLKELPEAFSPKEKLGEATLDGYLRFVLKEPAYAFGHDEYARIISKVANANMQIMAYKGAPKKQAVDAVPEKHKLLGNIFHGITGVLSSINPVAGMLINGAEKLHVGKVLGEAEQELKKHKDKNEAAIKAAQEAAENPPMLMPPRPAFSPKIKTVTAHFSSKSDFVTGEKVGNSKSDFQHFHIHPFGISSGKTTSESLQLLPDYEEAGYLYIGLEKVDPPQELSLLFVLDEGSGDHEKEPPEIEWSCLSSGKWKKLPSMSVEDGTLGFIQSGIIVFDLPAVQGSPEAIFSDHIKAGSPPLYWLRATARKNANAVCRTLSVYPHAAIVRYSGTPAGSDHFRTPLPAGRISQLDKPHPGVAKVVQPAPSSKGIAPETEEQFYTRVQEHLRHKGRAITAWDYERIVLQKFPGIGMVRCLNHTSVARQSARVPGALTLLVLPAKTPKGENILAPRVNQAVLAQIRAVIEQVADPFASIELRSPVYEHLQVVAEIRFREGTDPGRQLSLLNEGLIRKIAPWKEAYPEVNVFNHSVSWFSILEYLNQQDSVEEVVRFNLVKKKDLKDEDGVSLPESFEDIHPDNLWGVITSAPKHILTSSSGNLASASSPPQKVAATGKIAVKHAQKKTSPLSLKEQTAEPEKAKNEEKDERKPGNALFIRNDWYTS